MKFFSSLNPTLTICSVLLLSIAILVIYSSSKELALFQFIFAFLGIAAYFFISRFDYRSIRNLTVLLYFAVVALLIVAAILGFETRGSVRWIPLGVINLQPSEIAKPILILLLADFWSKNLPSWSNIGRSLLWATPPAVLIFNQPDLGSTLTLFAIWLGMLFAAKVSFKKVALIIFMIILVIPIKRAQKRFRDPIVIKISVSFFVRLPRHQRFHEAVKIPSCGCGVSSDNRAAYIYCSATQMGSRDEQ